MRRLVRWSKVIITRNNNNNNFNNNTKMSSDQLWTKVKDATNTARVKNAIFSIETKSEFIEEKGMKFNVSVSTALAKKPNNLPPAAPTPAPSVATTEVKVSDNTITTTTTTTTGEVSSETSTTINASTPAASAASATIASAATIEKVAFNPFLPHDPDMFVTDINDTHNLLLNKYNVVDYHMVLTTKDFQSQTDPLNETDFAALWNVVHSMNFLGFFNGGPLSGASQPHKHMQLLPPPVSDASRPSFEAPIEQLISKASVAPGVIFRIPELEFKHSCLILDPAELSKPRPEVYLYSIYNQLLASQDLAGMAPGSKSYNMLLTQRWMLIVPRSNEKYGKDLAALKEAGPMSILKHVTFPHQ